MSLDITNNVVISVVSSTTQKVNAVVSPNGCLDILSRIEIERLLDTSQSGVYELFRRCSLAVLNCGSEVDDSKTVLEHFSDYSITVLQQGRGIKLDLRNAPASAFVDDELVQGIREHLFAVLRDIVFTNIEISHDPKLDIQNSSYITNGVFHLLRNAGVLLPRNYPDMVVCWGGHAISREEYDYSKELGYQLGLRGLNVCTGCGPGAMKGPMKGAMIGHTKQRIKDGRYVGITEPGIIAAEPPNPIVNELVILPDIEKRLEAFVRTGHGFVVFPGGVGTAEEILFLIGILLHPCNAKVPFPLIFTGPESSAEYFQQIDQFIESVLGQTAKQKYSIVINNPQKVAQMIKKGLFAVQRFREQNHDAFYFNWQLKVAHDLQIPFVPNHETMSKLELHNDQPIHHLAANLRRAFSGIVTGNVKDSGIRAIEQEGPYRIKGNPAITQPLNKLLRSFVAQKRMKLAGEYEPCYEITN